MQKIVICIIRGPTYNATMAEVVLGKHVVFTLTRAHDDLLVTYEQINDLFRGFVCTGELGY